MESRRKRGWITGKGPKGECSDSFNATSTAVAYYRFYPFFFLFLLIKIRRIERYNLIKSNV